MRPIIYCMIFILIFGVTFSIADDADEQTWGKTKWGMTNHDLKGLFGKQLKFYPEGRYKEKHHNSCYYIEKYGIDDLEYQVEFYMDSNDKLDKVILINKKNTYRAFLSLESLLTQKYGKCTDQEDKNEPWRIKDRIWYTKSSRIQLLYSDLSNIQLRTDNSEIIDGLFLIYTKRKTKDTDKL